MRSYIFPGVLFFLLLSGCTKDIVVNPPGIEAGNLLLKIDRQNKPQNVVSLTATLSRSGYSTLSQSMNLLSDTTADVSFDLVTVGIWHLKVDAYDSTETIVYTGETDVNVLNGTTIQVNLTLIPTGNGYGNIYIFVTWGTGNSSSWKIIPSGTTSHLQCIFFIDTLTGWISGGDGTILKSTNGGNSWFIQPSGTSQRINWVHFLNYDLGFAVGENGTFLKTVDGGDVWSPLGINIFNSLYQIFFTGPNGWVVGTSGIIMKTTDAGESWSCHYSYDYSLFGVHFVNPLVGWAVGQTGIIIKTTNGGNSWFNSGSSYWYQWLQSVKFFNENTGVAAGGLGSIIRTTNGGYSWNPVNSGTTEHFEDLSFVNSNVGYAAGDHGTIKQTTNGGISWISENHITNYWLNSVYFLNENSGWAVGNSGIILKH